jgi:hypothetical protein
VSESSWWTPVSTEARPVTMDDLVKAIEKIKADAQRPEPWVYPVPQAYYEWYAALRAATRPRFDLGTTA